MWADWEVYHYALVIGTAAIALAATQRSNTNPRDWARDEAEERERRRQVRVLPFSIFILLTHNIHIVNSHHVVQAGLPVEYGVNYAGIRYLKERGVVDGETAEALEGGAIPQSHKPATRFDAARLA
jgi:hypothetical protein